MKRKKVDPAAAVVAASDGAEDQSLGQATDSLPENEIKLEENSSGIPDFLDRQKTVLAIVTEERPPENITLRVTTSPPQPNRREHHKQLIWIAWRKTAEAYLETGKRLIAAKVDLRHGEWEAFVESDLPFDKTMVERLMKIARNPVLANPANTPLLPAAWSTAYELTKVDRKTLEAKLKDGKISAKLELKEAKGWVKPTAVKKTPPKRRTKDDLIQEEMAKKAEIQEQKAKKAAAIAAAMPGDVGPMFDPNAATEAPPPKEEAPERDRYLRWLKLLGPDQRDAELTALSAALRDFGRRIEKLDG